MLKKIELPRKVLIGDNAIEKVSNLCKKLQLGKKAIIVSGKKTMKIAGRKVEEQLLKSDFDVEVKLAERSSLDEAEELGDYIEKKKIDFVVGVGGGKNIDLAKYASYIAYVPFISIPTAASHDGIASPNASFKGVSKKASAPIAIVADLEVISKAPYRFTAAGCGDLVANYTAVKDWELAHKLRGEYYGDYAAALALMSAKIIINNASEIAKKLKESVKIVVEALISSGTAMSIAGSSRPCSGAEHMFSHALDRIAPKPALHGEQCGVGTIMMAYLHGLPWQRIRDALKKIGAPTTARELGIEDEYIIKALTIANKIRPKRYTILGDKGITRKAAEELARKTGVIE